jgi:hypothetical protein
MTSLSKGTSARALGGKSGPSIALFFRRHTRIIAFFGATLVLGNYVVGDRLKERAKDAADDAASSASQFRLLLMLNNIAAEVHGLDEQQAEVLLPASKSAIQRRPLGTKPLSVRDVEQTLQDIDTARGQSLEFVNMMRQFDDQSARKGNEALDAYNAQIGRLDRELANIQSSRMAPNTEELSAIQKQLVDAAQQLIDAVGKAVSELNTDLIGRKAATAKDFATYDKWSIYLYIIGWVAAFFGHVFGVKGLDGG